MRTSYIALSLLLASCAMSPPNTVPTGTNGAVGNNALPNNGARPIPVADQVQQTHSHSHTLPQDALDRLDSAKGLLQSNGGQDRLSIQVMIQRPVADFSTQQLELSRIKNLRAWVEGPGLSNRILNLNSFVSVADQNQQTELTISQVPRGKHRVVTVQGYQVADEGEPPEVVGATLKAVYDSPADSTNVTLLFTWRSTAYAEIIESLLKAAEEGLGESTPEAVQEILDNLDEEALNTFLDAVIFGTNPTTGPTYQTHPDRLDPDKIAQIIIEQSGEIPEQAPTDPVPETYLDNMADLELTVQTPQKVPFTNSEIQVQITDPASRPIVINAGGDTGQVPQIVPGQWDAVVKLDGLNGGVSTRATVTVDENGTVTLTEGTTANPIILPPVITAIDKTTAGAGDEIKLTGDGFDPDPTKNTVMFDGVEAEVVSATATELIVKLPDNVTGTPKITVTSEDKTSNFAEVTVVPKITAMSSIFGNPGEQVTLTVSGYDPSQVPTTVMFNGSAIEIDPEDTIVTGNTITVTVPDDATSGPITLNPTGLDPLQSPIYTIGDRAKILSINPTAIVPGSTLTLTGVNISQVNSITINSATVTTFSVTPGTAGNPDVITLTVPSGVSSTGGPVDLRVTTASNGVASTPVTILAPPTIDNFDAPNPASPGTLVLQGTNYLPVTEVSIGGVVLDPSAYTIDNDGQITITQLPNTQVLGTIKVTNPAGSAVASLTYSDVENFIGNGIASSYYVSRSLTHYETFGAVPEVVNHYSSFANLHGINVDSDGYIYVSAMDGKVYKFNESGSPVAGWPIGALGSGYVDGPIATAKFGSIEDLANDANGNIYLADTGNNAIRKISKNNEGSLIVQTLARLPGPEGIEISRDGVLYVTGNNPANNTSTTVPSFVYKITNLEVPDQTGILDAFPKGGIANLATTPPTSNVELVVGGTPPGSLPRPSKAMGAVSYGNTYFKHIEGLGIDGNGYVYVADSGHGLIRRIDDVNKTVSVFADMHSCYGGGTCSPTTTVPVVADMHEIRVDREGNVFVPSGYLNSASIVSPASGIYMINPQGKISLIAGADSTRIGSFFFGFTNGDPLNAAKFTNPLAVDFGPDGSLYIVDNGWGIRRIPRYHPASNLQMP